jgi:hypothetical protein
MCILQDSLARVMETESASNNFDKPDLKLHVNPHYKRIQEIKNTIDALLDIRLTLSVKKIVGSTISRNELSKIVENEKEKASDEIVKEEIDKVFDSYFNVKKDTSSVMPTTSEVLNNNSPVLVPGVEAAIDKAIEDKSLSLSEMENIASNSKDEGNNQEKGSAYVKHDAHHNSSSNIFDVIQ